MWPTDPWMKTNGCLCETTMFRVACYTALIITIDYWYAVITLHIKVSFMFINKNIYMIHYLTSNISNFLICCIYKQKFIYNSGTKLFDERMSHHKYALSKMILSLVNWGLSTEPFSSTFLTVSYRHSLTDSFSSCLRCSCTHSSPCEASHSLSCILLRKFQSQNLCLYQRQNCAQGCEGTCLLSVLEDAKTGHREEAPFLPHDSSQWYTPLPESSQQTPKLVK